MAQAALKEAEDSTASIEGMDPAISRLVGLL